MPLYDYLCLTCDDTFEVRLSMNEVGTPVTCPVGHPDAKRKLSVFASVGATGSGSAPSAPAPRAGGGCGSGCGCAH